MSGDPRLSAADELYALLPWYANGTLSPAETTRVEAALTGDPALRASLERVREERDETVLHNQTVDGVSSGALEGLMARIEAEAPRPDRSVPFWPRLAAALGIRPGLLVLGAVAAALVLIAGSSAITQLLSGGQPPAGEHYLTASVEAASTASETVLLVTFAPEASIDAVGTLLRAQRARIVEGPLAAGLYRIAVAPADAEIALQTFRDRKDLVAFAAAGQ